MDILGVVAGFVVGGAALYVWYRLHRSWTQGEEFSLWPEKKSNSEEDSSDGIEAFLAAYRTGNAGLPATTPAAGSAQVSPPRPGAAPTTVPRSVPPREAFVSGAVKVAYLSFKSGLRDHHVFAHVAMTMLPGPGQIDPALSQATLDLLVCNSEMKPVAAIDIIGADAAPVDSARLAHLKTCNVRYLRLTAKSLPKPEAVRALLYRA